MKISIQSGRLACVSVLIVCAIAPAVGTQAAPIFPYPWLDYSVVPILMSPTELPSLGPLLIASYFDADAEGWTIVDNGSSTVPDYVASGGNPGGHVSESDAATGFWYWRAPAKFLGDQSAAHGGALAFDLKQSRTNAPLVADDVILVGAGRTLTYRSPIAPGTQWTSYVVPLDADLGWIDLSTGLPASESDLLAVLSSLDELKIRGDYQSELGNDIVSLDNVSLHMQEPPPAPVLPAPANQVAVASNGAVNLSWSPVADPQSVFSHYAVYRSTGPFGSVAGRTPIATIPAVDVSSYTDETAVNGVSYHYAVTTVNVSGLDQEDVDSVGPRTPFDATDLQVLSVARLPRYPRYDPHYTYYTVTEPSGFGPYGFSAATGLGSGQTGATPRWPATGDPMTYTATVRNRGTNPWAGELEFVWSIDGVDNAPVAQVVDLEPGETVTFSHVLNWDAQQHTVGFELLLFDSRLANNRLAIDTKSVPFLTYVDRSYIEQFREDTRNYSQASTDDFLDWLNRHLLRFNDMFDESGSAKRTHYGVLSVLDDHAPNPSVDRMPFAIFPFRFHAGESDLRSFSGGYRANDDIDYCLLHEMGHQLGIIDLYRLDLPADLNAVSGQGYSGPAGVMHGCSDFVSTHSALAMNHWLDIAHGYFGQYLYEMPENVRMRFLGSDGEPLENAVVKVYQKAERPGLGEVITDQIKVQGHTDSEGYYTLPNVDIDPNKVPTTYAGDTLHDNPFGYLAVIGTNGLLHFRIEYNDGIDFAWLDITEVNVAYWQGQTEVATFERQLAIGGPVQFVPPAELTELNANDWSAWAQGSTVESTYVEDDTTRTLVGDGAIRFVTDGGFDTYVRYPRTYTAVWNLSCADVLQVSFYAENQNSFQSGSPWIRLRDAEGSYFEYQYYRGGSSYDLLNEVRGQWGSYEIPLDSGDDVTDGWRRTTHGAPDLSRIQFVEIHTDTWGYGFTLWVDGVRFDSACSLLPDFDRDGDVDAIDISEFATCMAGADVPFTPGCETKDLDQDGDVDQCDFGFLQRCMSGGGVAVDPNCVSAVNE